MKKAVSKFMVKRPEIKVGDTVVVDTVIRDGDKKRIQKFKGLVISIQGKETSKSFTVRKISYGVGVEKIFPFHSSNVENVVVLKHGNVRRSKLYYLRDRVGKAALYVKPGKAVENVSAADLEDESEEEVAEVVEEAPQPEIQ